MASMFELSDIVFKVYEEPGVEGGGSSTAICEDRPLCDPEKDRSKRHRSFRHKCFADLGRIPVMGPPLPRGKQRVMVCRAMSIDESALDCEIRARYKSECEVSLSLYSVVNNLTKDRNDPFEVGDVMCRRYPRVFAYCSPEDVMACFSPQSAKIPLRVEVQISPSSIVQDLEEGNIASSAGTTCSRLLIFELESRALSKNGVFVPSNYKLASELANSSSRIDILKRGCSLVKDGRGSVDVLASAALSYPFCYRWCSTGFDVMSCCAHVYYATCSSNSEKEGRGVVYPILSAPGRYPFRSVGESGSIPTGVRLCDVMESTARVRSIISD